MFFHRWTLGSNRSNDRNGNWVFIFFFIFQSIDLNVLMSKKIMVYLIMSIIWSNWKQWVILTFRYFCHCLSDRARTFASANPLRAHIYCQTDAVFKKKRKKNCITMNFVCMCVVTNEQDDREEWKQRSFWWCFFFIYFIEYKAKIVWSHKESKWGDLIFIQWHIFYFILFRKKKKIKSLCLFPRHACACILEQMDCDRCILFDHFKSRFLQLIMNALISFNLSFDFSSAFWHELHFKLRDYSMEAEPGNNDRCNEK